MEIGLHHIFLDSLSKYADRLAVVNSDYRLTYKDLDYLSNQLANQLQQTGVKEHDIVALFFTDGVLQIAAILAVFKINATYLPLNVGMPHDRVADMLSQAECSIVFSDSLLSLPSVMTTIDAEHRATYSKDFICNPVKKLSDAYVIFTSGSTGKPKGVLMGHEGPVNTVSSMDDLFSLTEQDALIQNVSISFDPSIWLIFWPLAHGAKIIVPDNVSDADHLCALVARHKVRVLHSGPALFSALIAYDQFNRLDSLRLVIGGGQSWQLSQLKKLASIHPRCGFCNVYGPTEASIHATAWSVSADGLQAVEQVLIGQPIRKTTVYILDKQLNAVLNNVAGELCIGGIGLAKGYINNLEQTRKAFIVLPSGERLYKTGDLALYTDRGELVFLGRVDEQVQVRGYRVELSEIESALYDVPCVRSAAIIVDKADPENFKLRAFIVPNSEHFEAIKDTVRDHLSNKLPNYMLPSSIDVLHDIPLNYNFKPDASKLLALHKEAVESHMPRSSSNKIEQALRLIWEEVLNKSVGIEENFFDAGGDSLDALKLVARANSTFGVSLSVMDIFEYVTVSALSEHISTMNGSSVECIEAAREELRGVQYFPLSDNQQWLMATAGDSSVINNIVTPLAIEGELDLVHFETVIRTLAKSHEILRMNLNKENLNQFFIRAEIGNILSIEDISASPRAERQKYIDQCCFRLQNSEIDLCSDPLFKAKLLVTGKQSAVFLIFMHHIISDPSSVEILLRDFLKVYDQLISNLTVEHVERQRFSQYVLEENARHLKNNAVLRAEVAASDLAKTATCLNYGNLNSKNRKADFFCQEMSEALSASIFEYARNNHETLFMVFLSAFAQVIHQTYKQPHFTIGVNISRRNDERISDMLGPLSEQSMLPFDKCDMVSHNSVVASIKARLHEFFGKSHLTIWKIYEQLCSIDPATQPNRLFNTLFDYEPLMPQQSSKYLQLRFMKVPPSDEMRRDLTLRVSQKRRCFEFQVRYRKSLFCEADILNLVESMVYRLDSLVGSEV